MDYYRDRHTVRARVRRALASATQPLAVADLADRVDTTERQTRRALLQLETTGEAVRRAAAGGRYEWHATR